VTRPGRSSDQAASTRVFAALLLAGATLAAFSPVLSAGFVIYDDERYVLRNPHVHAGLTWESLRWALTSGYASNWHPLTWLSHMLDWRLFGAAAWGHHLTSLLLHAATAVLLFLLLDRATGATGRSAFAAALFALHPLHVESVAWVAERKDVLSTLLWLVAAGLAAKPMLVTLPLTLLLLDFWPLARWPAGGAGGGAWRGAARLFGEKVPLLALSAASAAVTVAVQASGPAIGSLQEFPLGIRTGNALVACVAYLGKTVWPLALAVFYPHPVASLPLWKPAAAAALLAAAGKGRGEAGDAERAARWALPAAAGTLLLALALLTRAQAATWKNSVSLFEHALAVTEGNYLAHLDLGTALSREGRRDEALAHRGGA
jgi:hypothetical protein